MKQTCLTVMAGSFLAAVVLSSVAYWHGIMSASEVAVVIIGCAIALAVTIINMGD